MEGDGAGVAGLATYAATIALAGVYLYFFINCGITDGTEMTLPHAISAAIAGIQIHPCDILTPEHYLVVIVGIRYTISDAIMVTIAHRADIGCFERPDGVKQSFLV
jgi:hypothetical protein